MDIIERVDIPYPAIKERDIHRTSPLETHHYTNTLNKQNMSPPVMTANDAVVSATAASASTTCNAKPLTGKTNRDHIMISNYNKMPAKKTSRHLWSSDDKHPDAISPRQFETWIRAHQYSTSSATSDSLPSLPVAEKSVVRKRSILSLFSYSSSSASGTVNSDGIDSKNEAEEAEEEEAAISDSSSSRSSTSSTSSEEDEPPTPTNFEIFPAGFDDTTATVHAVKERNYGLLEDEDRKTRLLQYAYLLASDQQKELQQQLVNYQQESAKATDHDGVSALPTLPPTTTTTTTTTKAKEAAVPVHNSTDTIDTTATHALDQPKTSPISLHVDHNTTTTTNLIRNSDLKRKSSTTSTASSYSFSSTSSRRSWFSGLLEKSTKQKKRFSELFSLKKRSKRASTTSSTTTATEHVISSPSTISTVERKRSTEERNKQELNNKMNSTCLTNDDFINDTSKNPTRYPPNTERAIYRLSHIKLGNARRPLQQQVVISNFMYRYLSILQQQHEKQRSSSTSSSSFYSATSTTHTSTNYYDATTIYNTNDVPSHNTNTINSAIYYYQRQQQQSPRKHYPRQSQQSSSGQQQAMMYNSSTIKTNIYKATCSAFEPPAPGLHHQHHHHRHHQPQQQQNSVFVSPSTTSSQPSSSSSRRKSLLLLPRKSSLTTSGSIPQLDKNNASLVMEKEQKRQSKKDKYKPIRNSQFMMVEKRMVQSVN